jgi:ribonuclease HI
MEKIMSAVRVYTDGGLAGRNPSPIAGTWAWCWVGEIDERVKWASGVVLPCELGVREVTNNQTELVAAVLSLEALPEHGQRVEWYTDSLVTLIRLTNGQKWQNISKAWKDRALAVRCRIGRAVLLAGHPSEADLRAGWHKKKRLPVSTHNRFCDKQCQKEAKRAMRELQSGVPRGTPELLHW